MKFDPSRARPESGAGRAETEVVDVSSVLMFGIRSIVPVLA